MSDNITLPREVVELALEVVELALKVVELSSGGEPIGTMEREAIEALRTALAAEQPKPEPVAWRPRLSPNLCFHWSRPWSPGVPSEQTVDYWNQKGAGVEYAYAAPPDAEALRRDAERYRWGVENARWVRHEHEAYVAIPVAVDADLSCTPMMTAAIDAAMQEDKT